MKRLRVTVDGRVFEVMVEVLDEGAAPAHLAAVPAPVPVATPAPVSVASASVQAPAAPPKRSSAAAGSGVVTSPLAGRIIEVHPKVGQQVSEGDLVITLEAMKMNTQVFATCTGKVSQINVKAGDAVQEGDPLLTVG